MRSNIIAFSGAQGTGKSTLTFLLAGELKKLYPSLHVGVLTEVASTCPFPINDQTTPESQLWIFCEQMRLELEMSARYDIVVADRLVIDSLAYTRAAGFEALYKAMRNLTMCHIGIYRNIFYLLPGIDPPESIHRSSSIHFQYQIDKTLKDVYDDIELSTPPIYINLDWDYTLYTILGLIRSLGD